MNPDSDPRLGTVLNGTYRLEEVIGSGGMGTVYRARHVHLGTEYAIKALVPQFTANEEALKRFQREAHISSQLGHPNIVKVCDFNYDANGTPFMVMDLLRGETLRQRILRVRKLTLAQLLPLVKQLSAGLDAAHAQGVVHRDLKPENLFLCEGTEELKILDFGVSKIRKFNTQLTRPMAMLGTPFYMSPEQAMGNTADVDSLSDVWAVGAICFEALTGGGAFQADNPVAVFYKIVNDPFPLPSASGADVPRAVDRVLSRACAKLPAERFQTTGDLYRELELAATATDEVRIPGGRAALLADQRTLPGEEPNTPPAMVAEATQILGKPLPSSETKILPAGPLGGRNGAKAASTQLLPPSENPLAPGFDDERTGISTRRPAVPVSPSAETALVTLPEARPAGTTALVEMPPLAADQTTGSFVAPPSAPAGRHSPAVATAPSLAVLPARFARWQLAVIVGGVALAGAAIVGTVAINRKHEEARESRARIDSAVASRRWDEADRELHEAAAKLGATPDLTALAQRVEGERRAEKQLGLARDLRAHGDGAAALVELAPIDSHSVYSADAARLRDEVVRGWESDVERALAEHRCSDAQAAARRLQVIHRAVPSGLESCREDARGAPTPPSAAADAQRAFKRREWERARDLAAAALREAGPSGAEPLWRVLALASCMTASADEARRARGHLDRAGQREVDRLCRSRRVFSTQEPEAPKRSPPPAPQPPPVEPPVEASGMEARAQIAKMLATAEPFARRCFAKMPTYQAAMKLRVTAFPGSDHFVATAISTGPEAIRTCLEALFKSVRPPKVNAAVSAERVYGAGG